MVIEICRQLSQYRHLIPVTLSFLTAKDPNHNKSKMANGLKMIFENRFFSSFFFCGGCVCVGGGGGQLSFQLSIVGQKFVVR